MSQQNTISTNNDNDNEQLLTEEEFYKKYCEMCGSQRCEGIGTDWFDGCRFKDRLTHQPKIDKEE